MNLKTAKIRFTATAPVIVDYWFFVPAYAGHLPARLTVWDGAEDAHHTTECPDYEHDCWREGCGKTWSDSYDFGAKLEVLHKGNWKRVGEWTNFVKSGVGF
jgi:hypothetical protein